MSAAPHGIIDMVVAATRETYANGGIRGFYRGIGFTLLRAAPVAGVVLPVYDAGLAWLARPKGRIRSYRVLYTCSLFVAHR